LWRRKDRNKKKGTVTCMKKDLNGLSGNLGKVGNLGCGGVGMFGKLRMAVAVLCLGLYIILCGVGGSGFVSPALAGENGTLLWWGNTDVDEPFKEKTLEYAAEARVSVILGNQPGETEETLKDFLIRSDPASWEYPVTLFWSPGHGSGWAHVGGYTPTEIVAMVEEAKGAIGEKKIDTLILGPCYSGNIEVMSCFSGLTKNVFGTPATATLGMLRLWLLWIERTEAKGEASGYENYLQYEVSLFNENGKGSYGSLVDPEEALAFLQALREKDLPASVFQDLRKGQFYYGTELNDIWKLAEDHGLGDNLLSFTTLWNAPYGPQWENHDECCYLGVWNGENEDLYIATVPEANRCIPGSSVTPDEPTPVPEGAASGGGGGCMVGVQNFPALLLLIPLTVVMMKKGKK
jgi:hypothetical protein